jgi:tRNA dimethylallyltransferase
MTTPPRTLALVGPTGTGKSAVSLRLAEQLGAEIVCADSRQLYCGLDTATGKPSRRERTIAPHHLFDWLDLTECASAGRYARAATACVREIHARGAPALLVGGTGLYLRALWQGLAPIPPVSEAVRDAVRGELAERGPQALHADLEHADPATAARLSPRDAQRITRALEVLRATGRPLSWWITQPPAEPAPLAGTPVIGLTGDRALLYETLDARTREFFAAGALLDEVRELLASGTPAEAPAFRSIGYAEAIAHVRGACSLESAITAAQQATRRYAKRQWTWWGQEAARVPFRWIEIDGLDVENVARRALAEERAPAGPP